MSKNEKCKIRSAGFQPAQERSAGFQPASRRSAGFQPAPSTTSQWHAALLLTCLVLLSATASRAQTPARATQSPERVQVKGVVIDETGETLPGASIVVKGTPRGVTTDADGTFSIEVKPTDALEVSFLGYEPFLIAKVGSQTYFNIKLTPTSAQLEEVTVVAFGKQKKESVIASISTVNIKDVRVPSSNLTTAFAGKIPGMISYQTTGEPGNDNAQFFIRGVTTFGLKSDPLILIDGFEATTDDLARLQTDDIEAFSILKDASATVMYGARGANGIIAITTKSGTINERVKVSGRFDMNISTPTAMLNC